MTDLEETLKYAEKQRERLAAIIRVFVFLALLAAVLSIRSHGGHHHPVLAVTIAYGILADRRIGIRVARDIPSGAAGEFL